MVKEMEVEKIYQKKSQLEHILLRPDTYIGSTELLQQDMWIWDFENEKMIKKEISFVPGLYKIYDEILVNAADNKQRDKNMSVMRINIDKVSNTIKVFNNGRGIPVVMHKEEKIMVPTMIFGHLLTSSNYNDDQKKVTGGRNGYGAKLCNIFSKKFVLETSTRETKKSFKQVWKNNMSIAEEPEIKDAKDDDFTKVTFVPDLSKFKMTQLDDDTVALLARRAYDIAATNPGVKVYLNDKRLPISKFEDYCKLYLNSNVDDMGNAPKLIYERFNERWEVAIACSDMGFQQVSFVNSIATSKGGRHVDYINDQMIKSLSETVNKKNKTNIKPFQIKNHMWVFVNCLIENPTFDSQTKENMTSQIKNFGSKCELKDEFIKKVSKSGLLDKILTWMAFKEKTDLEKAGSKSKVTKVKGIPKLDDANDAGTKESVSCTLIVTEGDSAKTLAVAGLGVIGRDKYGVFPLRGKMLNVREASTKQILENSEVSNLLKIIGLNFKEKYETRESMKHLRYGKLMIMTDQDHDGSHIKGLIINFVHHQWPNLLKHGFVEEFITPIVKVTKRSNERSFYSMPEFEEWQTQTDDWNTWKIKYYKGLGTSTSKEAKEYFSDMKRHRILFGYANMRDDMAIQLAFSKRFVEERKDWLTRYMMDRKYRRENNGTDNYLYQKNTKQITFTDFVNKELVLFSNLDNERSIPCMVDGFKPGQRKVLFSCFKRNLVKELKVAQLAGSVAELSAYHHGEASLMSTIINLAQNFVGSNNINLLLPIGQFGTRLHGGKDAASPRYIFTCLSPLTRLLFNPKDDPLFKYINDDGLKVEPEWYCPIIPTVLVNGAEGIGTGWSTKIPNYNPREIIDNIKRLINGKEPVPMEPFYKNFRGKIEQLDDVRVITHGKISIIEDNTIEITELPISMWTQKYKEDVLESMLHGENNKPGVITDYREYHTDTTVRFVVKMTNEQFRDAQAPGIHKYFKLQKPLSLNSMVLFDQNGCLKRYDSINTILNEFFHVRLGIYVKRKAYMEGMLGAESLKLDNIARFIMEKIEGKIKVENLKKIDIVKMLKSRKYDADPVNAWKKKIERDMPYEGDDLLVQADEDEEGESGEIKDYDYLLGMPIWNLTMEKKDKILKEQKEKGDELRALQSKTPNMLWMDDLDHFLAELNKIEAKERDEESTSQLKAFKAGQSAKSNDKKRPVLSKKNQLEYLPAPDGEMIVPVVDALLLKEAEKNKEAARIKRENPVEETIKKEMNMVDVITLDSEEAKGLNNDEIADFALALSKPTKKQGSLLGAKKAPASKVKAEKTDPTEQPTKVKPEKTTPEKSKKKSEGKTLDNFFKKSKKVTTSDDEGSNSDDNEISLCSSPAVKRSAPARARKDVKYSAVVSDSSDEETSKKSSRGKKKLDDTFSDCDDIEEVDYDEELAVSKPKKAKSESVFKKKSPVKSVLKSKENIDPEPKLKKTTSKSVLKKASSVDTQKQNPFTKAAKNKAKYVDSSDEDEVVLSDNDSSFEMAKTKTKKKLMDKSEEPFDLFKKVASKAAATKKAPARKAQIVLTSDED